MQWLDKYLGKFMYVLIVGLFLFEFSAGLAVAHWDTVHECQASACLDTQAK